MSVSVNAGSQVPHVLWCVVVEGESAARGSYWTRAHGEAAASVLRVLGVPAVRCVSSERLAEFLPALGYGGTS